MEKKLFVFLPAIVLATTVRLVAMESNVDQTTMDNLPTEIKVRIVGLLGDTPNAVRNLSLTCREWENVTQDIRLVTRELDASFFSVASLDAKNLSDYQKAIARYGCIFKARQRYFSNNLKQDEFLALQDFIIEALINELQKPVTNIDFENYIHVPLGLKINFQNIAHSIGGTPLFIACYHGNLDVVQALLGHGADANKARSFDGVTPLFAACDNGYLSVVQALLEHGADANKARRSDGTTPLFMACQEGHLSVAKALLEHGADVNKALTSDGTTPLFIACQQGHLSVVQALLEHGANVDKAKTDNGVTPLFMACQEGHLSVVQALIKAEANVDKAKTDNGVTPLFIACFNGHLSVAKALLEHEADVNRATTDNGTTPLFIACQQGRLPVVQALLGHGADVNKALTSYGTTPLLIACFCGHLDVVQALLGHEADLNAKINESSPVHAGFTALQIAEAKGFNDIAQAIKNEAARRADLTKKRAPYKPTDDSDEPKRKIQRKV